MICGKSRRGRFLLKRKTRRDRMRAKLQEIKEVAYLADVVRLMEFIEAGMDVGKQRHGGE